VRRGEKRKGMDEKWREEDEVRGRKRMEKVTMGEKKREGIKGR
jgi:hypothetical protein